MRVFLSGDTRTEWQSDIMKMYPNHEYFDPRTLSERTYKEMADTERAWIDQSDIVFAYLNQTNPYGFGTCFEIGYAVANKKLVIYIDEKQVSSSQWIAEHPVQPCKSFEEGVSQLGLLLEKGDVLIADRIVERLNSQDFTVLVQNELKDDLAKLVAQRIYHDRPTYTRLMLASKMLPRTWYDWNLGYLLQRLNPLVIAEILSRYSEHFYQSEGIAWALGLLGSDDERIVSFLQKQCQNCEDFDAWWCAAHSLEQLGHGNAIDILKRTLTQPRWQDIDTCLGEMGSRPATIGLLRMVNQNNVNRIVERCVEGLSTLDGRRLHNIIWLLERLRVTDSTVVEALTKLHNARVQYGSSLAHRVVEALGQIAHPSSRALLEKDLLEAQYFRTRAWAAKGLGLIGEFSSLGVLEEALQQEKDPHVLSMISAAIYNIRDSERRRDNKQIAQARWLENGMIIDETNKWYWSPEIYDTFSRAEDPESVAFKLAISMFPAEVSTALDLGSGTGRFIEEMRREVSTLKTVYALDNSEEMAAFLSKRFKNGSPRVEVLHEAISHISLPNESVDVVVSSWGFPSRVWDEEQAMRELREVCRVLRPHGRLITIGWDEDFNDEMTEVWYRFVMEEECYFDSLSEYRRRRRSKIRSPRNCGLRIAKKGLRLPVKFSTKKDAAYVFGHLFGYSAGIWVLESGKREFQMSVSITQDDRSAIAERTSRHDIDVAAGASS